MRDTVVLIRASIPRSGVALIAEDALMCGKKIFEKPRSLKMERVSSGVRMASPMHGFGRDNAGASLFTMKIEYVILADGAQAVGGKLYIMGGGWSIFYAQTFPAPINIGLGVVLISSDLR